jgi:hypothetical protein
MPLALAASRREAGELCEEESLRKELSALKLRG